MPSQTQPPQFTVRACAEPSTGATPKAPLKVVPRSPQQPCPCKPHKPSQWQPFSQTLGQNICPQNSLQKLWKPMRDTFVLNYPGVLLDQDTMPSIRLLSIVHHSLKPGQRIRWIPWQLCLSQKQYQEAMRPKPPSPFAPRLSSSQQPSSTTRLR